MRGGFSFFFSFTNQRHIVCLLCIDRLQFCNGAWLGNCDNPWKHRADTAMMIGMILWGFTSTVAGDFFTQMSGEQMAINSGMDRSGPKPPTGWWFGTRILFSHILGIIIPIDFHIFQRGGPTTNQFLSSPRALALGAEGTAAAHPAGACGAAAGLHAGGVQSQVCAVGGGQGTKTSVGVKGNPPER